MLFVCLFCSRVYAYLNLLLCLSQFMYVYAFVSMRVCFCDILMKLCVCVLLLSCLCFCLFMLLCLYACMLLCLYAFCCSRVCAGDIDRRRRHKHVEHVEHLFSNVMSAHVEHVLSNVMSSWRIRACGACHINKGIIFLCSLYKLHLSSPFHCASKKKNICKH